jgi:hypothetical protein
MRSQCALGVVYPLRGSAPSPHVRDKPVATTHGLVSLYERTINMPDTSDLSHLLLMKLRELSLEARTFSMVPSDKRIEIAGHSANEIEICFAQLVEEGFLQAGSAVDDDGNLVFTGLSTTGRDFVGAIRNQELPEELRRTKRGRWRLPDVRLPPISPCRDRTPWNPPDDSKWSQGVLYLNDAIMGLEHVREPSVRLGRLVHVAAEHGHAFLAQPRLPVVVSNAALRPLSALTKLVCHKAGNIAFRPRRRSVDDRTNLRCAPRHAAGTDNGFARPPARPLRLWCTLLAHTGPQYFLDPPKGVGLIEPSLLT